MSGALDCDEELVKLTKCCTTEFEHALNEKKNVKMLHLHQIQRHHMTRPLTQFDSMEQTERRTRH